MPAKRGGQVIGMRLKGIKPNSLLARLGFADADVWLSINGFQISNPQKALKAYEELRATRFFEVKIERNGKEVTLTYRLDE